MKSERLLRELDKEFPIARSLTIAEGAPGRLTSNIDQKLYNGLGFHFERVTEDTVVIKVPGNAESIPLKKVTARVTLRDRQFTRQGWNFDLGYWVTTHRLQGQTVDKLITRIESSTLNEMKREFFDAAMFLVQVSRVRKLSDLHLDWPNYSERLLKWLIRHKDIGKIEFVQNATENYKAAIANYPFLYSRVQEN